MYIHNYINLMVHKETCMFDSLLLIHENSKPSYSFSSNIKQRHVLVKFNLCERMYIRLCIYDCVCACVFLGVRSHNT